MDTLESLKLDPIWMVRTFNDALNRRDVNGALVLFADDAILVDMARASSADRAMLRNWLQSQACENDQSELSDIWVTTVAVTWTARVHRGEAVLRHQYHAEVEEGKINYLMFVGDSQADDKAEASALNVRAGGGGKSRNDRWQGTRDKNFQDIPWWSSKEKQCQQQ